ncbi:oxidoreductase [Acinetobacter sp. ANC 4558]|uniref:PDR/VanB family oxidoreductase n=1 Tax=Acinetobacter sp. ANC 4558 TaxID=1977876 RepID=UPI000A331C5A|nr:PDR/VanB family oxidoreductase [Acinetobacter sp. ANC 4558]OTG86151.1 oxidoreductase [Acinetobacter sp. ANC 4558]
MTILYDVKVTDRYMDGENISIIALQSSSDQILPVFDAGAHIDLHLPNGMVRQYSLCQNPTENSFYRLGILRDENSRGGSECVYEQLHQGVELKISAPQNLFPLAEAHHSILIGGGIGITPLITMAYQLHHENRSFELHYCGSSAERSAFLVELQDGILAPYTHFHFKNDGANHRAYFQDHFPAFQKSSHIYTCGPNAFMDWVEHLAKQHQFHSKHIHKEVFQAEVDLTGDSFEVIAKKSNKTIQVFAHETILTALAREGITIEKSCEQGICGTCLCDVLEGEPEHRDVYLTDDEKQDNDQIILCCSRSKSKQLVLDI